MERPLEPRDLRDPGGPRGPAGWAAAGGAWVRDVDGGRRAWLCITDRRHGDLALRADPASLAARRACVVAGPWSWLRQVHEDSVVAVTEVGGGAGSRADGAVTTASGAVLAVHSADCAVVGLCSPQGVVGAVHAGWRGLRAGVLERAVAAMAELGAQEIEAVLGPCIEAACYEFGAAELATIAERLGPEVVARTGGGRPALDLRAGVRAALRATGVHLDETLWRCTACDPLLYSHRARGDTGRSALVIRLEGSSR